MGRRVGDGWMEVDGEMQGLTDCGLPSSPTLLCEIRPRIESEGENNTERRKKEVGQRESG